IKNLSKNNRNCTSLLLHCHQGGQAAIHDDLRREANQLGCMTSHAGRVTGCPAIVEPHVSTLSPAKVLEPLSDITDADLTFGVFLGEVQEDCHSSQFVGPLRVDGQRPSSRRATQNAEKFPPTHVRPRLRRAIVSSEPWLR